MKKAPESELPGANGGEEGIRTPARFKTPATAFRVRTLRPLGYLSVY